MLSRVVRDGVLSTETTRKVGPEGREDTGILETDHRNDLVTVTKVTVRPSGRDTGPTVSEGTVVPLHGRPLTLFVRWVWSGGKEENGYLFYVTGIPKVITDERK